MIFSKPAHGEQIALKNGKSTRQFASFLQDVADEFALTNVPDEAEIVFVEGVTSLQLATFLQDAAAVAGIFNAPQEGEVVLEDSRIATFPFQSFLDDLAG